MATRVTGEYIRTAVAGEEVAAFVPFPLPPANPPVSLDEPLSRRLRLAEKALARLEVAGEVIPSLNWFLYGFVRKEAVLSSQIEGTQASLVDLLSYEANEPGALTPDIEEVCNYVHALTYARQQLADEAGLPLSMRLLNDAHRLLMAGVRGGKKSPGEIRRSQNWIGGSRPGNAVHVPPPPHVLPELLGALEHWLHADDTLPPLVRAGLAHVQFETIHPYLDGNGRIGRLLIALLLEHWGLLSKPLLYLSLFFKRHQQEYYRRLNAVRTEGDWEGWLDYFLDGVATVADEAMETARQLSALVASDRERVLAGRSASVAAARLFELLPSHPIVTTGLVVNLLGTTKPTASKAIEVLVADGILTETTGRKRDRSFCYQTYLDILSVGAEL